MHGVYNEKNSNFCMYVSHLGSLIFMNILFRLLFMLHEHITDCTVHDRYIKILLCEKYQNPHHFFSHSTIDMYRQRNWYIFLRLIKYVVLNLALGIIQFFNDFLSLFRKYFKQLLTQVSIVKRFLVSGTKFICIKRLNIQLNLSF